MRKTSTQRQAEYKARRQEGDGEKKLSMWVSTSCTFAIGRLAKHHGLTKRQIIMMLVAEADSAVVKKIEIDTPEWDAYFGSDKHP